MAEIDLWKEIGGVETDGERALECERPFVETAALAKRYLERENRASSCFVIRTYHVAYGAKQHLGYVKDGERIVKQVNGKIIETPPLVEAIRYISIELNSLGYTMGPFTCDLPLVAARHKSGKTEEMV